MNPAPPTLARLLADTAALFRGEADLIVRIAAPFVFLPMFAAQLLCDPLPALPAQPRDEAAAAAWLQSLSVWAQGNAGWYLLAEAIGLYGIATLAILLLDPVRPDVAGAMRSAAQRFGRFVLASVLVALPVGAGMWLWMLILPGLWLQARLIAVLPALAASPPLGARAALVRSWAITRGAGWPLTATIVTLFLGQWLALTPLFRAEDWLRQPGHDNAFLIALVDALLMAVSSAYQVALLLLGTVAYRRLASSGI